MMNEWECPGCGGTLAEDQVTHCEFCCAVFVSGDAICYICGEAPGHCGKANCERAHIEEYGEEEP